MTTTEPRQVPVPPGVAFQAAGPIVHGSEASYVSRRDLPGTISAAYKPSERELTFRMGFRDISGTVEEPGIVFDVADRLEAVGMKIALGRQLRRVSWITVFGIELDRDLGRSIETIRTLLDVFRLRVNDDVRLPREAEATLRLVYEMVPHLVEDLRTPRTP